MRQDYLIITAAAIIISTLTTNSRMAVFNLVIAIIAFILYLGQIPTQPKQPLQPGTKVKIDFTKRPNNQRIVLMKGSAQLQNSEQEVELYLPNTKLYKLKNIDQLFDPNWIIKLKGKHK